MSRLNRALGTLRRRGLGYGFYLLRGYLWPRLRNGILADYSLRRLEALEVLTWGVVGGLLGLATGFFLPWRQSLPLGLVTAVLAAALPVVRRRARLWRLRARARRTDGESLPGGRAAALADWLHWPVKDAVRAAVEASRRPEEPLTLGSIDADGRLLSPFGTFPDFDAVDEKSFLPRTRYDLDLVLRGDLLAVRKDFRGDRGAFLREWLVLSRLSGFANVPAVLEADEKACRLSRSFLPGDTVNDLLVRRGAVLRLAQTEDDPELAHLRGKERLDAILARGTRLLPRVLPKGFLESLQEQVEEIHRRGVTGLSLTFGNVAMVKTGESDGDPWLFDFDDSRIHASTHSLAFALERDRDRSKLNRIWGLSGLTLGKVPGALQRAVPSAYSPVDLGDGWATRGFWSVDSGTGRWDYLNGRALEGLLEGKRILDLGCHNGILPLLMLRAGAREVLGVERSEEAVDAARELHRIFEWRDMKTYPFTVHHGDMLAILDQDWGSFDLVTAFCSLYYLDEEDMEKVVHRAAELAPVLVLQAKTDTRSQAADGKALKSSLDFLEDLMRRGGFDDIQRVAPEGYSRPLLLGRKPSRSSSGKAAEGIPRE